MHDQELGRAESTAPTRRSRDRSRDKSRSRSWSRNRGRHGNRSRSKSRSRSRSRNREYRPRDYRRISRSQSPYRDQGLQTTNGSERSLKRHDGSKSRDKDKDTGYERGATDRGYQSRTDNRDRHRNQSSRRRTENDQAQGEPQIEVILQGLPQDCQENDIRAVIEQEDIGLETVRVARDQQTGESRGFGFLKFLMLQHAQNFVELSSPSIRIGQNWVRVAYSTNPSTFRETLRRCNECGMANDGHLETCHQFSPDKQGSMLEDQSPHGYAHRNAGSSHYQQTDQGLSSQYHGVQQLAMINTGTRDIGTVPNSMLVVTNLPPLVNESGLWNALRLLGPLVRILVAKDRQSRINWGFCFAEYADVKSATIALEKANTGSFTIRTKPVEIYYAHRGSFIPAYAPTAWTISLGNEDQLAIYWDEQAYLSPYIDPSAVKAASKNAQSSPSKTVQPNATATDELNAFYAAMGGVLSAEPSSGSAGSIFSVPAATDTMASAAPTPIIQDLPSIPTTAKVDEAQLAGIAAAQAAEQLAKAEEKKRKAGQASIGIGGGGKKVSIQLQKWSTKQVELQAGETSSMVARPAQTPEKEIPNPTQHLPLTQEGVDEANYEPDELIDVKLIACLLCQRKLKTLQDLRKHQALSELHKKNLQDPQAIQAALRKSRGISSSTSSTSALSNADEALTAGANVGTASTAPKTTEEEPKYRDRAAERRQIFGQPEYPLPPTPSGREYSGRYGGGRSSSNSTGGGSGGYAEQEMPIIPEQPTKDGIKEDNIGNRLLKSMGWKEGQGLGKDGEGITAPIEASGYAKGVGIGAGFIRKADGAGQVRGLSGNYALSAKELARRRYEQSG